MNKKSKGQYFTKNIYLKECVYNLIMHKSELILEPSVGRGDLVEYVLEKNPTILFNMYEIDDTINILEKLDRNSINFTDFLNTSIERSYTTIIGNPPYVKKARGGNLYLDFIKKCCDLLSPNGELIFIVPSDFIKLTGSSGLILNMLKSGSFTHFIFPDNENLFEEASIDVMIFRYQKDIFSENVLVNWQPKFLVNKKGTITFSETKEPSTMVFEDIFDIFVGMVSGKEEVFKNNELGNISVLTGENQLEKYICIDSFPTENEKINQYLLSHKKLLMERKIKKFDEKNWYEWGALRNYKNILSNFGKECIYIYNLSRKKEIAFVGQVQFFGGNLLMMIPKNKNIILTDTLTYLNSSIFKENYTYSGRFKIGHRQLSLGCVVP